MITHAEALPTFLRITDLITSTSSDVNPFKMMTTAPNTAIPKGILSSGCSSPMNSSGTIATIAAVKGFQKPLKRDVGSEQGLVNIKYAK